MIFSINSANAEKVNKCFTVSKPAHVYGYTKSAILTPKNRRMSFCYEIDIIQDIIVCTIRHKETDTMEAVAVFRSFTPESIEIEKADLYRNCSNYPYRTETADRYMRKYDQIACIVHGAIAAGLLFDAVEAPTTEETSTTAQDTTCTDKEPQEATESRHKYGMRLRGYSIGAQPAGVVERADDPTGLYYDIITYNRELTPEEIKQYSLTPLDAPTSAENAPQEQETSKAGETTTGAEKDAQRATEAATATANDTTPAADQEKPENAHRRTETAEAEHVPTATQTEPPQATDAAVGSVSQSDRRTRPAAPQSHETAKGIQRHHRPPKTAYRATQRAAPFPRRRVTTSHPDRRKVTFSAWMQKSGSDPPEI